MVKEELENVNRVNYGLILKSKKTGVDGISVSLSFEKLFKNFDRAQ